MQRRITDADTHILISASHATRTSPDDLFVAIVLCYALACAQWTPRQSSSIPNVLKKQSLTMDAATVYLLLPKFLLARPGLL